MPVAKKVKSVMRSYLLAVLTGLVFLLAGGLTHADDDWPEGIIAVGAGANERAITFTNKGQIFSSRDGKTWSAAQRATLKRLRAGAWLKDPNDNDATKLRVVIVGDSDTILRSEDAESFDVVPREKLDIGGNLVGVAWTGKQVIVVSDFRDIVTSDDYGLTWKKQTVPGKSDLTGIVWTGTQAVIVGQDGLILTSPDGQDWTTQYSGTDERLNAVAWSGTTIFVGSRCGRVLSSKDGIKWERMMMSSSSLLITGIVSDTLGNPVVVGKSNDQHHVLQRTASGGWKELSFRFPTKVNGLAMVFGELYGAGYVVGSNVTNRSRIFKIGDHGSWDVFGPVIL